MGIETKGTKTMARRLKVQETTGNVEVEKKDSRESFFEEPKGVVSVPENSNVIAPSQEMREEHAKRNSSVGSAVETVTVTWGKELYAPKQFHNFDVGPFSATVALRSGETHAQAMMRVADECERVIETLRRRKTESYLAVLREAQK